MGTLLRFLCLILLTSLSVTSASSPTSYRAAVYAHKPVLPAFSPAPVSRSTAVKNMMKNLRIYRKQAQIAARKGAQIIVFPEDGLYGALFTRATIKPYLEPVPDPQVIVPWVPCTEPGRVTPSDVLRHLSCMARHNRLYLVANMGDIKPCNETSDVTASLCPEDGHFQFNTDVVFDPSGTLIARYHKRTLFGEPQFDVPPVEVVMFDTPFGRFGIFTCFDVLFHDPAIQLLEKGVTNIVFPTAWIDDYPVLNAIGFHSAWARGNQVNFLAANGQLPQYRFVGTGIYSPTGPLDYYYNDDPDSAAKLIVVDVPSVSSYTGKDYNLHFYAQSLAQWLMSSFHSMLWHWSAPGVNQLSFETEIGGDVFRMVEVNDASGSVSVCSGSTCCRLSYRRDRVYPLEDYFAFGAFEGVHESDKDWYAEACLLVRCTNRSHSSCGEVTGESSTLFSKIAITGSFSTEYVYPEVLVSEDGHVALSANQEWDYSSTWGLRARHLSRPLLVAALYASDYSRDPP